jgi:hypothetical protein
MRVFGSLTRLPEPSRSSDAILRSTWGELGTLQSAQTFPRRADISGLAPDSLVRLAEKWYLAQTITEAAVPASRLLAVLSVVAILGCTETGATGLLGEPLRRDGAASEVASSKDAGAESDEAPVGRLLVEPPEVLFTSVSCGTSAKQEVRLTNTGDGVAQLDRLFLVGDRAAPRHHQC